ncbi:hypothetical protein V1515DRAFT_402459 [Lipomyces mesembrius]
MLFIIIPIIRKSYYMVSVLLTNIQTCLEEANDVSQSFSCNPLTRLFKTGVTQICFVL